MRYRISILIAIATFAFAAVTANAASISPGNEVQQSVPPSTAATEGGDSGAIVTLPYTTPTPLTCLPMAANPFLNTCGKVVEVKPDEEDSESLSPRETSPEYKLAPGDCLILDLSGDIRYSARYCVANTGNLVFDNSSKGVLVSETKYENAEYFSCINDVRAHGLTIDEFKKNLDANLSKNFRNKFTITISMTEVKPFPVNLLGAVKNPGFYRLNGATRITSALQAAGGPLENASIRRIKVTRSNGNVIDIDLYKFFLNEDPGQNIYLEANDTVFVSMNDQFITLSGQVLVPGKYELLPGEGYKDLIKYALGYTSEAIPAQAMVALRTSPGVVSSKNIDLDEGAPVDMSQFREIFIPSAKRLANYIYVVVGAAEPVPVYTSGSMTLKQLLDGKISPQQYRTLNLSDVIVAHPGMESPTGNQTAVRYNIMQDSSLLESVVVHPGDTLFLTDVSREVFVTGAVKLPGPIQYRAGLTVNDFILLAGGPMDNAKMGAIRIQRRQNSSTDKLDFYVNVKDQASSQFTVLPGDIVYVPNRSRQPISFFISQIWTYTGLISLFDND